MDSLTWVTLGSLGMSAEGVMLYGAAKLSRMAKSLEDLKVSVGKVAEKVDDHENRLNRGGL